MAKSSERLQHPVLGRLDWLPEFSHWLGRPSLPDGGRLELIVEPAGGDRHGFLPRAAELFAWATAHEARLRVRAIRAELLELYNDTWRQAADPKMSARELAARLEWQVLTVSASDEVPVEFVYEAGELFGGHGVAVEVDHELRFRDIDLRG